MTGLASSAANASAAMQDVANAWTMLNNDVGDMITSLEKGERIESDVLRTLFAAAAQNVGGTLCTDVGTTKTAGKLIRATVAEASAA